MSVTSSIPRISVEYWRRTSSRSSSRPPRGALQHEPALAADGHDHGVLDHLRLHQAQHLGAVVLAALRPPDAAAGDRPSAEVHALHLGVAHEDLEQRGGLRHRGHVGRAQLQAQPPTAIGPERVGAHGRQHELEEAAQDAVLVEARDGIDPRADRLAQLVHLTLRSRGLGPAEARVEQLEDQRGGLRMVDQDLALVGLGELAPHPLAIAAVGAQDLTSCHDTAARVTSPFRRSESASPRRIAITACSIAEPRRSRSSCPRPEQHAEVVQVRTVVRPALEARRHLLDDGHSEPSSTGSSDESDILPPSFATTSRVRGSAPSMRLVGLLVLQADRELLACAYALEQAHVERREIGVRRSLVVLREALSVVGGELAAAHVTVLDDEALYEVVVPGAARRADLCLE